MEPRNAAGGTRIQLGAKAPIDRREFPFLEPPDERAVADGWQQLVELGAVGEPTAGLRKLTEVGRQMARLPVDVKLARMLVAAQHRLPAADAGDRGVPGHPGPARTPPEARGRPTARTRSLPMGAPSSSACCACGKATGRRTRS
jgi:ATP-dependent helicase HrpA